MLRSVFALALLVACALASAAPVPAPAGARDRDGNPLPAGATARLGSVAFRALDKRAFTFSPDGKQLWHWNGRAAVALDAATGRPVLDAPFDLWPRFARDDVAFVGNRAVALVSKYAEGTLDVVGVAVVTLGIDGKRVSRFEVPTAPGFNEPLHSFAPLALARDGALLALRDGDALRVFDLTAGKEVTKLPVPEKFRGARFSADGKVLFAVATEGDVRRYSVPDGKELPAFATGGRYPVLFEPSPDGNTIITRFWSAREQRPEPFLTVHDATGKARGKLDLDFDAARVRFVGPDAIVAVPARAGGASALARFDTKTLRREWRVPCDAADAFAVSPDGTRVAALCGSRVRLFDAATGKRLDAAPAHDGDVMWVRFAPDGDAVYTFSEAEVRAWAAKDGAPKGAPVARPAAERGAWGTETPLAFTARTTDGKGFELTGWDAPAAKVAWRVALPRETWRVLSHDGNRATALVWDAKANAWGVNEIDGPKGTIAPAWRLPGADQASNGGRDLALSGDGKLLFVADGNEVAALDARTGREVRRIETGPTAGVDVVRYMPSGIAVSHDGSRLAVMHRNRHEMAVRTFDTTTGRVLAEHDLSGSLVNRMAFAPAGTAIAVWNTASRRVLLLDGVDGKVKARELSAGARPSCAAFSPNGASLAVGYEDGTTLLWDVAAKAKE